MDNFAQYTPKFFHSKEEDINSGIPPRLDNFEHPFSRILQFTFQDAFRRQNQLPPNEFIPFRVMGFGNISNLLSSETLKNIQGFAFYESMTRIFGAGVRSGNSGILFRKMPQGSYGFLLHGMIEGANTDLYGAIDWRSSNTKHYNADIFCGLRSGRFRVEGSTRIRDGVSPFMDLTALKGVMTMRPFFDRFKTRVDVGGELSMMEGSVSNAFGSMKLSILPWNSTVVLGLTVLGYLNVIYGYKITNYLTFASMFDVHLITYAAETSLATKFNPEALPETNIFRRNNLLKHIHSITGRINPDHGLGIKIEFVDKKSESLLDIYDEISEIPIGKGQVSNDNKNEKEKRKIFKKRLLKYLPQPADTIISLMLEIPFSRNEWSNNFSIGIDIQTEW